MSVTQAIKRAFAPRAPEPVQTRQHTFETYDQAIKACARPDGYDDTVLSTFIAGKSALYAAELDRHTEVADHAAQTMLVSLIVSSDRGSLRVVDFGGGCALPFATMQRLCGGKLKADWRVVELPTMVSAARAVMNVPNVSFNHNLNAETCAIDLVHTAGTLQYTPDPRLWLSRLLALKAPYAFFGRCAFATGNVDVIGVQRSRIRDHGVQVEGYDAPSGSVEYPFTYIPKRDFEDTVARHGYNLVASFESASGYAQVNEHRIVGGGYLYKRK